MMPVRQFEWDEIKAESNVVKHGVTFPYAVRVFYDASVAHGDVSQPEDGESRWRAVGIVEGNLFTVVYTMRGNVTRIISARRSNRKEEREYGNGKIHS